MKNKHYVVLTENALVPKDTQTFRVVCLMHDVSSGLKRVEADALANSMNLESCREQQ